MFPSADIENGYFEGPRGNTAPKFLWLGLSLLMLTSFADKIHVDPS